MAILCHILTAIICGGNIDIMAYFCWYISLGRVPQIMYAYIAAGDIVSLYYCMRYNIVNCIYVYV